MMRILYVTEIYPDPKRGLGVWGGGEKQFYEISRRVAKRGHQVYVLTCRFPEQPFYEYQDGVHVYRVGLTRDPQLGGEAQKTIAPVLSYILKTGFYIRKFGVDIVHCNAYFPVFAGKIGKLGRKVSIIRTFHDVFSFKGMVESQHSLLWGGVGYLVNLLSVRIFNGEIIAVSQQCKEKLIRLGAHEENITVIPNGVDLKLFDSVRVKKCRRQILYVGRLVNYKHVDWLIMAFKEVLERFPDARLKIIGDGPERPKLEALVRDLGLNGKVVFGGLTPTYEGVVKHYKESEVFVLPSTFEGEGIVLKEAMAAYLPVIGIRVKGSGVLNLIKDGKNGYLVNPGRPDFIAEKIIQLLQDRQKRERMGKWGRKFVEKFDWDVVAEKTLQLYKKVIESQK